jgi:pimeloyl-ACP methyl ester carboxylesterase
VASQHLSFAQARDAQLPHVPMTLITGMRSRDMLGRHVLPHWLEAHRAWLRAYPQARHLITTNSGHDVILTEPELVAQAVRDLLKERATAP